MKENNFPSLYSPLDCCETKRLTDFTSSGLTFGGADHNCVSFDARKKIFGTVRRGSKGEWLDSSASHISNKSLLS